MSSMTCMLAAGAVKEEDDDTFGIIQGLSFEQAQAVADWLALATDGPVAMQWMNFGKFERIERDGRGDSRIKLSKTEVEG